MNPDARDIVVVPHTHWDREWYLPFQRFRLGLVRMLDEVLETMAADPGYRFTMDGQLAALEDYLEIRPERRGELAGLIAEGRLAAGPWLILADEFLCSGETLVRNLEYGVRGVAALTGGAGAAMRVGYLPDQFGHCAQMPQILALAGLEHACVWRGVPAGVDRDAFAWTGADGTVIRTQYLPGGYGNAVALFGGPAEGLPDRLAAFAAAMRPWRPEGPMLAMYGADHSAPAAGITAAGLRLATLGEYVTAQPPSAEGLPVVRGELRSHARANILPGVLSARVPAKAAMARAERVVTRYAEPLATLWLGGSGRGAAATLLDMAWRRLIACSGHDSVTGCGADDTAQQVEARIAEAGQIGQAVVDMVAASLAARTPRGAITVVNPAPYERSGLVLADLPENRARLVDADGAPVPLQRLELAPTLLDETVMDDLTRLLGRVHERELFGFEILSWEVAEPGVFTVVVGRHAASAYEYADLRAAVLEAAASRPGPWTVRTLAEPVVTVAALVTVPPLGRATLTSAAWAPPVGRGPAGIGAVAPAGGRGAGNGLLTVAIEDDGTLTLRSRDGLEARGVGRIVDGGDAGDTYNHAPPARDRLVSAPAWVKVEEVCRGPLVWAAEIVREYSWPRSSTPEERSAETVPVVVTTRAELRAGEPFLRLEVGFDNRALDHRVRWHAPLPAPAAESYAAGQFAVVRRGTTAEGGGGERPLPTFPAESFVTAGGLALLLDQATEYELIPDGPELAITLVRSVGHLSRNRNPYRDEPAGPEVATPGAQCPGPITTRFAVHLHTPPWHEAALPHLAEDYRHDLLAVPGTAPSAPTPAPLTGPLSLTGEGVVLAALRERDGLLEARLVAEHPSPTEAVLTGPFTAAHRADIVGATGDALPLTLTTTPPVTADSPEPLERPAPSSPPAPMSELRLPLRPFEIVTLHLATPLPADPDGFRP